MTSPQQGYNALGDSEANPFAQVTQPPHLETDNEDEAPHSGIMIHVVPETNRGKFRLRLIHIISSLSSKLIEMIIFILY